MSWTATTHRPRTVRKNRPLEEFYSEQDKKRRAWKEVKWVGKKWRLRSAIIYVAAAVLLIVLLGAASSYHYNRPCQTLDISIAAPGGEFLNSTDIQFLAEQEKALVGASMGKIDLALIESRLLSSPYIEDAQAHKDFSGALHLEASIREPIATLVNNDGSFVHVDKHGVKFPSSIRAAADVPLIRGNFDELATPQDSFYCETVENVIPVLQHIHEHPFWSAQVSEVEILNDGQVNIYPELGDHYIEFGYPVRISEKFDNVKLFYDQVVKKVGWRKYKAIKAQFRGQVVGVKR